MARRAPAPWGQMQQAATRYAQRVMGEMAARQSVSGAFCVWPPIVGRMKEQVFLVEGEAPWMRTPPEEYYSDEIPF